MDYNHKREMILTGSMSKTIIQLSLPIMFNNFIQTIYNLTDTFWVSKIGDTEVAAITLVWPLIFFIMSLAIGIFMSSTTLISQYVGDDNTNDAANVAGQSITLAIIISVFAGLLGYFLTPSLVSFMGGTGRLYTCGVDFMQIMYLGMPTMFVFNAHNCIRQGLGDTVTPMKFTVLSVIMNIVLDPIFIFCFDLGIKGAAYATVLSRGVFAVIAVYDLFAKDCGIFITTKHLKLKKSVVSHLVKIGVPLSIGQSTAALGFTVLNYFIISFGENTMAAFGIGNRINSLVLMPAMGIGSALATIVGQNLGADNIQRAKNAVKTSVQLTTTFLVIGCIIMFLISGNVIGIFTKNPDVLEQGIAYLKLISLGLPLMGFFQIFIGTFQGSGHTIMAMIIMMGRLWLIRIPMILLLKEYTNLGSYCVWYSMVSSNAIICLVGLLLYKSGRWEKKVIKKTAI